MMVRQIPGCYFHAGSYHRMTPSMKAIERQTGDNPVVWMQRQLKMKRSRKDIAKELGLTEQTVERIFRQCKMLRSCWR